MTAKPVTIVVTGEPVAKGRGRAAVLQTGRAIIFTPKNTRKWEADARQVARLEMGSRLPMTGPVHIDIRVVFVPAKSWPDWKRNMAISHEIAHTTKPDIDNLAKSMKDALNGIVYDDDAQIIRSVCVKEYGPQAMVVATVTPVGGLPCQVSRKPV